LFQILFFGPQGIGEFKSEFVHSDSYFLERFNGQMTLEIFLENFHVKPSFCAENFSKAISTGIL